MIIGDLVNLKIEDMLDDGRGFARADGLAVFVDGGVLGDTVEVVITKVKKNIAEAKLVRVITESPDRIKAECPYFHECGGCSLQELKYEAQLRLKENQVLSKLERIAGIENPKFDEVIPAETLKYYRNKATFAVGPNGEVGFYKGKSHYVMDIDDCILQSDPAMACADALRRFLKHNLDRNGKLGKFSCLKQLVIKTAFSTGEVMAVIESTQKEISQIEELVDMLDEAIFFLSHDEDGELLENVMEYKLVSVSILYEGKNAKPKSILVAGKPTIVDELIREDGKSLKFEIGSQSFYQVNPEQMAKLYQKAFEYADLIGNEIVLDLYCGIGTIGLFMADKTKQIIGIESVKPAVIDANRNAVINEIINARYFTGKAEEVLPALLGYSKLHKYNEVNELVECELDIKLDSVDVAIVDPPRAGCHEALLQALASAKPRRIVYVSCDAGTLARDLKYLTGSGYEFDSITLVDQFPRTTHVETVTQLSLQAGL